MKGQIFTIAMASLCYANQAEAEPPVAPELVWSVSDLAAPESALHDPTTDHIFVSLVDGAPDEKDGKGAIAILSTDGEVIDAGWVVGLNAPKGLGRVGRRLYVADIDEIVEIDIEGGAVIARHPVEGAKFLNDVATDAQGRVYVTDMLTDRIHVLDNDTVALWYASEELKNPNGVFVDGERLIVGSWGRRTNGYETDVPGMLLAIDRSTQAMAPLGNGVPIGNLDGVVRRDPTHFLVTDWVAGKLLSIDEGGQVEELLSLGRGTADLDYLPSGRLVILPLMLEGRVVAYRLPW